MPKSEIMPADGATSDVDEVKGPDPKVWGPDDERPVTGPPPEALDDRGKPMEVKGPDPKVWGKQATPED